MRHWLVAVYAVISEVNDILICLSEDIFVNLNCVTARFFQAYNYKNGVGEQLETDSIPWKSCCDFLYTCIIKLIEDDEENETKSVHVYLHALILFWGAI